MKKKKVIDLLLLPSKCCIGHYFANIENELCCSYEGILEQWHCKKEYVLKHSIGLC